jgi:hypothetical protein
MTNHPNRSSITHAQWLNANDNQDLCNVAGDLAFDALAAYFDARDQAREHTASQCKDLAEDEGYKARKGWEYGSRDDSDPAGDLAKRVLERLGYRVRSGSIGYDATLTKIDD